MITPTEIKRRALRVYPAYLSSFVRETAFFPLDIRFGKSMPRGDFHIFDRRRAALLKASALHQTAGYSIDLTPQQTRRYGEQHVPTRIYYKTEKDYLEDIGKTEESERFKGLVQVFKASAPELLPWLVDHPVEMIPYLEEGGDLLNVCLYLRDHPRPGCYIRELPIEVHTKFIEEHAGILRKLLDTFLPEEAIDKNQQRFAPRYGFREADPLIRIRLLTERAKQALKLPLDDMGLPATIFQRKPFQRMTIVIVENLMTFLTLPARCGDVVVFGKGFQLNLLTAAASLSEADLLYWSDLDAQGFMMLSQFKSAFPLARSVLMDRATLDAHASFVVKGTPATASDLPALTEEERALFRYLNEHTLRLEQERIGLNFVKRHWPR